MNVGNGTGKWDVCELAGHTDRNLKQTLGSAPERAEKIEVGADAGHGRGVFTNENSFKVNH